MKVRLEENSLRLRLKQNEVQAFYKDGKVSSITKLGLFPGQFLRFTLIKDKFTSELKLLFGNNLQNSGEANQINLLVPDKQADAWAAPDSQLEGFEAYLPLEANESLFVLVEKDFRCLHKGPDNPEDVDSFPNPMKE